MAVVSIAGLRGEALGNAMMKCLTKGKRRVTMSICGLGILEESETDTIPHAAPVRVDMATGEVLEEAPKPKNGGKLDIFAAALKPFAPPPSAPPEPVPEPPAPPPANSDMEATLLLSLIQQHRDKVPPPVWVNLLRKHQLGVSELGRADIVVLSELEKDLKAVLTTTRKDRPASTRPEPEDLRR
jgi:hypothetical protein